MLVGGCALAVTLAGCGKKGPPLAPIVRVPSAIQQMTARRLGGDVYLTLTLPTENIDQSAPVDLARVEVYGYTGTTAPPVARFTEVATLVGTLAVTPGTAAGGLRETLTPETLKPGPALARAVASASRDTDAGTGPGQAGPLKRFYLAVTFSERGRAGPPSAILDVPLVPTPDPPLEVRASYSERGIVLTWQPSGGLVGFLLDLARPPEARPLDLSPRTAEQAGTLPFGPTRYNVYLETGAAGNPSPRPAGAAPAPPTPLNAMPTTAFTFSAPVEMDERRRCYTVRAVRGAADAAVEGRPSAPVCITPVDTFPPAAPRGLSPLAAEGAIGLIWEANTEPDLAGYMVLRGAVGDATLTPVTDRVITETRFTDEDVQPGGRYVYAVVAVDRRQPRPNVSVESERVEVEAR